MIYQLFSMFSDFISPLIFGDKRNIFTINYSDQNGTRLRKKSIKYNKLYEICILGNVKERQKIL